MNSIPASQLVSVIPSVLGAGGNPLSLNAVFLTGDPSIPIGTVKAFASLASVQNWFGATAPESLLAAVYFGGFTGATTLPGTLYFAQYNAAAVAGYLRGGSQSGVALSAIQALSGTITISFDGAPTVTTANINLAAATSFSNAAQIVQTALQAVAAGVTCTYDALRAGFVITSSTTGANSSVAFPTNDALTTGLKLEAANGAVQSPGAAIAVPATLMNQIVAITQNWATFMTVTEPLLAVKLQFANWVNSTSPPERYTYACFDTDLTPTTGAAPNSFGGQTATFNGVETIFELTAAAGNPLPGAKAAFFCGTTASIDFTATQGRITYAYKNQAGLSVDVTDATIAANLLSNGYNFYGAYATANQGFQFYQNGQISGLWLWADAYINQIAMNAAFQLALVELLASVKSIPYNQRGYSLIRAALADPINQFLNFGAIQPGVTLSAVQAQEVNTAAGVNIAPVLQARGWYLQILDASPQVRGQRGSPPMTFWYTDGGSIQKLNLASIDVQ